MKLKYFAYGSNMLHYRLWERVPSCTVLDQVSLKGYNLNYSIRGVDDSGKCNIIETSDPAGQVHGVIFEMASADLFRLDAAEGESYTKHELLLSGQSADHKAFAYLGNESFIDESLKPFDWYKAIVLAGAKSQKLPTEYINLLDKVSAKADHDNHRSTKNFKIIESNVPE